MPKGKQITVAQANQRLHCSYCSDTTSGRQGCAKRLPKKANIPLQYCVLCQVLWCAAACGIHLRHAQGCCANAAESAAKGPLTNEKGNPAKQTPLKTIAQWRPDAAAVIAEQQVRAGPCQRVQRRRAQRCSPILPHCTRPVWCRGKAPRTVGRNGAAASRQWRAQQWRATATRQAQRAQQQLPW